jgi:hypothetical protein
VKSDQWVIVRKLTRACGICKKTMQVAKLHKDLNFSKKSARWVKIGPQPLNDDKK